MTRSLAPQIARLRQTQGRLAVAVERLDRVLKQGPTSAPDKRPALRCGTALKPRRGGHSDRSA